MKFLNYGSLNIDKIYEVEHFVRAKETCASLSYYELPGSKGLNQSIALARLNIPVYHAGKIGKDGLFLKELSTFGVERIDPVGEPFDPNVHQAISMIPSKDVKPNCIVSVMQKGFILNGRVVRPAMVMVARAAE